MPDFRHALNENKILVLDGAMGTMLQASGMPAGVHPERFCLDQPHVLGKIHSAYVDAGANIITTCTFGGNSFKLPDGIEPVSFNRAMAEIAGKAAGAARGKIYVAGDIGPTGCFVRPLGDKHPDELLAAFRAQVRGLLQGGVDLFFIETQFDLAEARLAVAAVRMESDLPVLVSMTFEKGVSLTGTTPEIFAETMQNMGVDALGVNCGAGPDEMADVVRRFLEVCSCPVLVEPNAGLPELKGDETVFRLPPEAFANKTAAFAAAGARLVGGCCGTTPDHIKALRRALDNLEIGKISGRARPGGVVLTSLSHLARIGANHPFMIIGERINPTGKSELAAELQAGEFTTALRYAEAQHQAGATVLDVNVGAPFVDEAVVLPDLTQRLVAQLALPLSLDSSNAEAIIKSLPFCPGSALINSISGEKGRMEILGPACRLWGAPFILLPLRGKKLPVMAKDRIAILEELLDEAEMLGIPRRLVLVDILALAVSSKPEAGRQSLEMIKWCAAEGLPTVCGLSNTSFGLPARDLLNGSYLALAAGAGLNSCIANPENVMVRDISAAVNVLLGHDRDAESFIKNYAGWTPGENRGPGSASGGDDNQGAMGPGEAVLYGRKENIVELVEKTLADGHDPFKLVNDVLIPAITEVGRKYEKREIFLPQLIRSAETMQAAFAVVKPLLEAGRGSAERPVAVLATVEGDIHDIGKNIVALLLGNHGFEVVDAGKDRKADDIISCAKAHKAAIIGLSALMTTTMVRMEDTVKLVRENNLPFKVMVGGAVVTQAFADAIGADGYSADAVGAARVAKKLLNLD